MAEFRIVHGHPLGIRPDDAPLRFQDLTDDGLAELMVRYQRELEDIDSGQRNAPRWVTEHRMDRCRQIKLARFALRMRYGAKDSHLGATHSYDRYYRLDEVPSYQLALSMDRVRWQLGRRHVMDWQAASGEKE